MGTPTAERAEIAGVTPKRPLDRSQRAVRPRSIESRPLAAEWGTSGGALSSGCSGIGAMTPRRPGFPAQVASPLPCIHLRD